MVARMTRTQTSNPFGPLDDKDLSHTGLEVKGASAEDLPSLADLDDLNGPDPAPEEGPGSTSGGVEVVAIHHLDYDGSPVVPGAQLSVDAATAAAWNAARRARLA